MRVEGSMYLISINGNKTTHVAYDFEGAYRMSISTYCGTDASVNSRTMRQQRVSKLNLEVNENTITCKKCLKKYLCEVGK